MKKKIYFAISIIMLILFTALSASAFPEKTTLPLGLSGQTASNLPKALNCAVSDLTSTGYTVTCDISDNSGVVSVEFLTWTLNNGDYRDSANQDDLTRDPAGRISGRKVSYRVNISDHNNETDVAYATYIYAYDAVGNTDRVKEIVHVASSDDYLPESFDETQKDGKKQSEVRDGEKAACDHGCKTMCEPSSSPVTRQAAINWLNAQQGEYLDYDCSNGVQCVDLVMYYYNYFGMAGYARGNGADYKNNVPPGWKAIQYYSGFVPEPGDVAVWNPGNGSDVSTVGHVAVVLSADQNRFMSMDQNWNGVIAAAQTSHSYNLFWGVVRPAFGSNPRGNLDLAEGGEGTVRVAGWAIDDDAPDQTLQIHVYVGGPSAEDGGEGHSGYYANIDRTDVGKHGFDITFRTDKRGSQPVYVYGINVGEGSNALLQDNPKTVSINGASACGTNVKYQISGNTISFSKNNPSQEAVYDSTCTDVFRNDPAITIVKVTDTIRTDEFADDLFSYCRYVQEMYLSKLDVSAVMTMSNMFRMAYSDDYGIHYTSLQKLDLSGWNTSAVTHMNGMFGDCYYLESLDLSNWDTSNVESMYGLFAGCSALTSLNVSNWNTSNVIFMDYLFLDCSSLKSLDLSNWNTSNVESMTGVFGNCSALTSLNVSSWDTSSVEEMNGMFSGCSSLTSLNVSGWNTSNVTDMRSTFYYCSSLTSLDVSRWNTSNVICMSYLFSGCSSLKKLDVSRWNTSAVYVIDGVFSGCSSLTSLNLSGWTTSQLKHRYIREKGIIGGGMYALFRGCSSLTSLDLSSWDVSGVFNMNSMFKGCSSLKNLNISGWDTSSVETMDGMFAECSSLQTLDLSKWNTSNVEEMGRDWSDYGGMFEGCSSLKSLDLSGWDTSGVNSMYNMFTGCEALHTLTLGENTLRTNIFETLPAYNYAWYYRVQKASDPFELETKRENGKLFTDYDYVRMAGTWSTDNEKLLIAFENRCYELFLGRKADAGGLNYYMDLLKAGKLTGAQMVMNFINSPEFQGKKYDNETVVEILYNTMMGRTADASGLAYWTKFLDDGMSQKYIVRGFAGSAEFKKICSTYGITSGMLTLTENRDKNPKVTAFVSRNYRIALGRKGDVDGLNYWTGKILEKILTPQQVADSFVFSKECVNKKLSDTDFVKMLYNLYMDRNPGQGEINYYIQRLGQGTSRQTIVKNFGASPEFKKIVASYGL